MASYAFIGIDLERNATIRLTTDDGHTYDQTLPFPYTPAFEDQIQALVVTAMQTLKDVTGRDPAAVVADPDLNIVIPNDPTPPPAAIVVPIEASV